jgi:transposase
MMGLPAGTRIWIAAGVTDMRAGMNGLAAKVQMTLAEEPLSGHVFVFRGRRGNVVKVLWATSDGACSLICGRLVQYIEAFEFGWQRAAFAAAGLLAGCIAAWIGSRGCGRGRNRSHVVGFGA